MSRRTAVVATIAICSVAFLLLVVAQQGFDPDTIDTHWSGTPLPPCFVNADACFGHVLGTDVLGRDILARLGRGGEVSLGLTLVTLVFELAFGIMLGVLAR